MEWSTMVVPTYTLKVAATPCRCANTTIRLCESALSLSLSLSLNPSPKPKPKPNPNPKPNQVPEEDDGGMGPGMGDMM